MKRNNTTIGISSSRTPSVVLAAFAPETAYELTLDGYLLMEAMGVSFTRGDRPGVRDIIIAMLIMTDYDAVLKARRLKKFDELFAAATKDKRPAHILPYMDKVEAAIKAAFDPTDDGVAHEKKPSTASAGG